MSRKAWTIHIALAASAFAQTQIHLATQSTYSDFSAKAFTKPAKTGTTLPATCSVGEQFFKTDATAGQNLYGCVAANVWAAQAGGSGLPSMAGQATRVLSNDGVTAQWRAMGGDVSGDPATLTVTGLRGRALSLAVPTTGQVLQWNGTSSQWEPTTPAGGVSSVFGRTGAVTSQTGDYAMSQIAGIAQISQGGTGAVTAGDARASLGAAAASHTHLLTELSGIAGKNGNGTLLQVFGGGTAAANDCAKFDAAGNLVSAGAPCGVTGGGNFTTSGLTDGTTAAASASLLSITAGSFRFGLTALSTPAATATLTPSGAGVAYVYVTADGLVNVDYPVSSLASVACVGCTARSIDVPSFPAGSIPLALAAFSSSGWGAVTDQRALLSTTAVSASTGAIVRELGGLTEVGVDSSLVGFLGNSNAWTGGQSFTGVVTVTGSGGTLDASGAASSKPARHLGSDPASCAPGEVYFHTAENRMKVCGPADVWTAVDSQSVDPGQFSLAEEFCPGDAAPARIGTHGWSSQAIGLGGVASYVPSEANHPCLITATSDAATGNGHSIALQLPGGGSAVVPGLGTSAAWEAVWIFRPESLTDADVLVGFSDSAVSGTSTLTNGIWARFISGSDTAWVFETRSGGLSTTVSSAHTATAGSWWKLRIRSLTAGTVQFSLSKDGGPYETEGVLAATVPGVALTPVALTVTKSAAAKAVTLDYFGLRARGVSR